MLNLKVIEVILPHLKMLKVRKDQEYVNLCMKNRQIIGELIQKIGSANEIDACFQALYGLMMLKS